MQGKEEVIGNTSGRGYWVYTCNERPGKFPDSHQKTVENHGRFPGSCLKISENHGKFPESHQKTVENHGRFLDSCLKNSENHSKIPDSNFRGFQHQNDRSELQG